MPPVTAVLKSLPRRLLVGAAIALVTLMMLAALLIGAAATVGLSAWCLWW